MEKEKDVQVVKSMPIDEMRKFKLPNANVTLFDGLKTPPKEFYFHSYNREVDVRKVSNLVLSMQEHGFYKFQPIVANSDGMVVDGQHRLLASIQAGIEPIIHVYKNLSTKHIVATNTMRNNWSIVDFVHYYAMTGSITYRKLLELSKKYKISPVSIQQVLTRQINCGSLNRTLKDGNFHCEVSDFDYAEKFLSKVMPILDLMKRVNVNRCLAGLLRFGKINKDDKDFDRILKNMKKHPDLVHSCTTTENYREMFISLYNKGLSEGKKIRMTYSRG